MAVRVRSPATSANLGAGFDVFGMALEEPFDTMELSEDDGVSLGIEGFEVPQEVEKNCAGVVALSIVRDFGLRGVRIKLDKGIRPASGMGSSAASAAGVAFGLSELFGLNLGRQALIRYAALGERVSSGAWVHYDNVTPCILGGFNIFCSLEPLRVLSISPPENLGIVIAMPDISKGSTEISRAAVPRQVPIVDAVRNVANASSLVAGFCRGDLRMIKDGMNDSIAEPARARAGLLRQYEAFKELGKRMDAGIAASGAGPSMIAIVEKERREEVGLEMRGIFEESGVGCRIFITAPGGGARLG